MNRVWVRAILLGVVAAALIGGAIWLRSRPQGLPLVDLPAVDSKGYIAALREDGSETHLVVFDARGKMRVPPQGNFDDREIDWKPDGRRIIFVSNRASSGAYQVFEWLPDRENEPTQLTPDGASRENPWFALDGRRFLYSSQGDILATSYPELGTERVMPPSLERETVDESGQHIQQSGEQHNMISEAWQAVSGALDGEAFDRGYVDKSGKYFVGVYETARGQALVMQDLEPADPKLAFAKAPIAGDSVQVSMDPSRPIAVASVRNFHYPMLNSVPKDKIKPDGSFIRDFINAVFIVYLDQGKLTPIFFSADGAQIMESPSISPDGRRVALVAKEVANGREKTIGILAADVARGGIATATLVAEGNVSEPSWSPDGEKIIYIKDGDIYTVSKIGGSEQKINAERGPFRSPQFSPMR